MKNKEVKNTYYAYMRKSSEGEDRQVQSIERQHDEIMKLIEFRALTVAEFFQENRSAMMPNNRPEFSRMIQGIKKGRADGIICWHLNRLARNPLESGIIQQLLEDGKIKRIITKDREYTPADNAIIFSVESGLATQYSKDLGKMVKSGLEKKVNQGIAPIHAPLGYLNTRNAEHGSNYIIKDKNRFAIVRKVWDLMLTGEYTPTTVLHYINNNIGLKTKFRSKNANGTLSRSGLYKILNNIFYTGLFKYNGEVYQGKHEPMITLEEFDRVQELLGRDGKPRNKKHQFTYTGMMTCKCGSAITATKKNKLVKSTGMYQTYIYYHCTKRKKGCETCTSRPYAINEFDNIVGRTIDTISISGEYRNLALKAMNIILPIMIPDEEQIEQYQENEVSRLHIELKNLLSLRVSDTINNEDYVEAKKERELQIMRINKNYQKQGNTKDSILALLERNLTAVTDLKEKFISSELMRRKSMLLSFGSNYIVSDKILIFDKPNWLKTISENREDILKEIQWLELDKSIETYNYLCDLRTMCPLLCGLVDEVRTETPSQPGLQPLRSNESSEYG